MILEKRREISSSLPREDDTVLIFQKDLDCRRVQEIDHYFLNNLNIGDPDSSNHRRGFGSPEDVIDWFHQDRSDDWRQRD